MAAADIPATSTTSPTASGDEPGRPPVPPRIAALLGGLTALTGAVTAHLWPGTKQQPVAVAGTVTAFVSATLSLGIGFAWWQLTQSQNASLIGLVTTLVAVASALVARNEVKAGNTPARSAARPERPGR